VADSRRPDDVKWAEPERRTHEMEGLAEMASVEQHDSVGVRMTVLPHRSFQDRSHQEGGGGLGFAASAVDVQANQPQVAGDASSNATARFPTNKQNEPTIAVNPTNPSFLLAGANDEQRQPPCGPGPVRGSPANDCSFFPGGGH
jgi:hypothetical protein